MEKSRLGDVQGRVLLSRTASGEMDSERPRSLALGSSEIVASLIHSRARSSGTRTESNENALGQQSRGPVEAPLLPSGTSQGYAAVIDLVMGDEVAARTNKKTRSACWYGCYGGS